MSRTKAIGYFLCFALLFGVFAGLAGDRVVMAAQEDSGRLVLLPPNQEEPPPEEKEEDKLELETKFPVLSGKSGDSFEFEVELSYQGSERRRFDLTVSVPTGWAAVALSSYPEKQIEVIELDPGTYSEKVKVIFAPLFFRQPEPGEYAVTLEIGSEDLREAIELKAKVTARYDFSMGTETGRLNTEVNAGEENHFSILLENPGSAVIEKLNLSSSKPEGWNITFNPEKVDSLEPGLSQEVDVVITPPRKTIAGDYMITLRGDSKEVSDSLDVRVTVLTPTIWGWVGILIVLAVIAGLGVLFRQLGRR